MKNIGNDQKKVHGSKVMTFFGPSTVPVYKGEKNVNKLGLWVSIKIPRI
jgi:hypothetical protein